MFISYFFDTFDSPLRDIIFLVQFLQYKNTNKAKLMKTIAYLFLILCISFPGKLRAVPQFDIPEKIFTAIEIGNVQELSEYFNNSIELILEDQEDIYSRQQAEKILEDFFENHPPVSFKILHQGGSENAKYAIGNLKTENSAYRVHFLVKMKNGEPLIHQLRIQEEK